MKPLLAAIAVLLGFSLLINSSPLSAHELTGFVAAEYRSFFNDPLFSEQKQDNGSLALQPEYYHEWQNGSSFTFVPFARFDSQDSERTHFDIRELNFLWLADNWEMRIGLCKVFWGVTEFVHLVDIVNQTDLVENPDGEDKLGQPMMQLSIARDWGMVDVLVLPWFRERTFPGQKGRLRFAAVVDTDNAIYESSAKEQHVDLAARYSHFIGDLEFGIYHFAGTSREPTLLVRLGEAGNPVLIPYYQQINQTGLDLQLVAGRWLLKLESLYRIGQDEEFFAAAGGFEYSLVGIFGTKMDLGIIGEYAYDERDNEATTPFQDDVMFGLRLTVNDMASSEMLAGVIQDLNSSSQTISVEAGRRFGDQCKVTLESGLLFDPAEEDVLYGFRDDEFIRIELAYYF